MSKVKYVMQATVTIEVEVASPEGEMTMEEDIATREKFYDDMARLGYDADVEEATIE